MAVTGRTQRPGRAMVAVAILRGRHAARRARAATARGDFTVFTIAKQRLRGRALAAFEKEYYRVERRSVR